MVLAQFLSQSTPAAALLTLASILPTSYAYALPQKTTTIDYNEFIVLPWPLATAAPFVPGNFYDLQPRQLNSVCGYIGGDPSLPATCSAGSHCAVDVGLGAVGCCPDGGACTKGIFTGCVDANSGPQNEINPNVFTCQGGNVCYKNSYDGGFFQFGCASASDIATSVIASASGKSAIQFPTVSAILTAQPTTLSQPTTLGTQQSKTSDSSTKSESTTSTASSSKTSSSVTSASDSSATDATASRTKTATTESASATGDTATGGAGGDAPDTDGNKTNTGAIVGGTIGGVAALVALIALAIWLWKRKKNARQGPGTKPETQYISRPMSQNRHTFAPLPSAQEVYDSGNAAPIGTAHTTDNFGAVDMGTSRGPETFEPNYPYGYGPGSTAGGIGAIGGGAAVAGAGASRQMEPDEIPLTRESEDYQQSYGHPLNRVEEGGAHAQGSSKVNVDTTTDPEGEPMGPYRPHRDGGGGLWQQNRGASRNLTWL